MELLQKGQIEISPPYLLALSKQVDVLSKLAVFDRRGPLTQEFSQVLHSHFSELAQYLALYAEDTVMRNSSLLRCKLSLSFFVWQKAISLLPRQFPELKQTFTYLFQLLQNLTSATEGLIHQQRTAKAAVLDSEKDRIIAGLRRELLVKREYVQDLEQRAHELEDENSKLYSKLVSNAKQKVDYFSKSNNSQQFRSISSDKGSPRKKPTSRSYEDEIIDIIESKRKHEAINERRSSLSEYLRSYFTVKYGRPLAEQNEASFRETVCYLARSQDKHIFVLFQAILDEECDEAYFLEERSFYEKITKCLKRFINQKYNKPLHELDRLFEGRSNEDKTDFSLTETDVEAVLNNVYKFGEVQTLQMILSELVSSRGPQESNRVSCRRFVNELLDYELKKHLMRVEDIVREIQRLPDRGNAVSFEQLQRVVVRTVSDRERCQNLLREQQRERPWTVSEVIEIIQRARHARRRRE